MNNSKERVVIVSVVRDKGMYDKCISSNPYTADCEKTAIDNTVEKKPVPTRYNSVLENIEDDCWLVFCHEDWMPLCKLDDLLAGLDRNSLYGPIGVFLEPGRFVDFSFIKGSIRQMRKDGSGQVSTSGEEKEGIVGTFDCQCLIVHSSLAREKKLRFDENLNFDLYVEDFCVQAYEKHGIGSRVIRIPCIHYSYGKIGRAFKASLKYLKKKYSKCARRYVSIAGHNSSFGGNGSKCLIKVSGHKLHGMVYRLIR